MTKRITDEMASEAVRICMSLAACGKKLKKNWLNIPDEPIIEVHYREVSREIWAARRLRAALKAERAKGKRHGK